MSCSIAKETKGFIPISADKWEEFRSYVIEYLTDYYMMDSDIRVDDILECEMLEEAGFITMEEYDDLRIYCDVVEFNIN